MSGRRLLAFVLERVLEARQFVHGVAGGALGRTKIVTEFSQLGAISAGRFGGVLFLGGRNPA